MAKRYGEITEGLRRFIESQRLFFVATAPREGRVNLSPKGLDSLRIMDSRRVVWLNLTGSGNETAAHLQESSRMTLMFVAFEGEPMILRLYGEARAVHRRDPEWGPLLSLFPPFSGARQLIDMRVDLVQTSCGFGVPLFEYKGERETLLAWTRKKGEEGIEEYWRQKNRISLDGIPTRIVERNLGEEE